MCTLSLKWICINYIFHNYFNVISKYCKIIYICIARLKSTALYQYSTLWVRAASS